MPWACAVSSASAISKARGNFDDCATAAIRDAVGPAQDRCPIEVPVGGLDQSGLGDVAVHAIAKGAKVVKRGHRATRGDFEDRARVLGRPPSEVIPHKFPLLASTGPASGSSVVRVVEAVQRGQRANKGNVEDRAVAVQSLYLVESG
jgi:hypothetical protein